MILTGTLGIALILLVVGLLAMAVAAYVMVTK